MTSHVGERIPTGGERIMTDESQSTISRRRWLAAVAGGTALSAGCMSTGGGGGDGGDGGTDTGDGGDGGTGTGDGGDGGGGGGDGGSGQIVDDTYEIAAGQNPADSHFNPFNASQWAEARAGDGFIFEPMTVFNQTANEWEPHAITDWTFNFDEGENGVFDAKVNTDLEWHDGSRSVQAKDLATKLKLQLAIGDPITNYTEKIEVLDEETVRMHLSGPVNQRIFLHTAVVQQLNTRAEVYKDFISRYEEAEPDSKEMDQMVNDLLSFKVTEPVGNGPWKFDEANSQYLQAVPNENYPLEATANAQYVVRTRNFEEAQKDTAVIQGELDATQGGGADPDLKWPDHVYFDGTPNHGGGGMAFNQNHPVMGKRLVRKAITYVLDRQKIGKSIYKRTASPTHEVPVTGLSVDQTDVWLDDPSQYELYEVNTDKADELMKEAGYERGDNGYFVDGDGKTIEAPIHVPGPWQGEVEGWTVAANMLDEWGIKSQPKPTDTTTLFGDIIPNNDFVLTMDWWGSGAIPHPFFSFQSSLYDSSASSLPQNAYGIPEKVEVPMPIGDPQGSMKTIDLGKEMNKLATTTDEETGRKTVQKLAWVFNQYVPQNPPVSKIEACWMSTDDWNVALLEENGEMPAISVDGYEYAWRNGGMTGREEKVKKGYKA